MIAPYPRPRLALTLLTIVYVLNFVDRQLVGILGQAMKADLGLSDTQLGMLGGLAFALFYTVLGIPVARLAERRSRVDIVAVSLAIWSAMTALCGLAQTFLWLLVARVGVGVGEAGCAPPSQSLIAELTPPHRRATALAIFSLGVPIGMLIGAVAGGWIAQTLGWRAAFLALGLPGVVLAIVVGRVLPEPQGREAQPLPSLGTVALTLIATPGFLHMALGASLASFAGYGVTSFAVPLAVRSYGLPLSVAASGFGLTVGLAVGIGIGGGGWLSDRLSARYGGAPGLIAGVGTCVAAIIFQLAIGHSSALGLAAMAFVPLIAAHLYFGPTYGVTVNSVGLRERATAIALLLMAMNAIGLGLGPLFVGTLSDHFAVTMGPTDGLAMALRINLLVYLWATVHFLIAARRLTARATGA